MNKAVSRLCLSLWALFLFLQHGSPWDESEHAHVAWLISQGQRPITDFFQHHTPLLWTLLTPYYTFGLRGPGVLIWGRALVVASAMAVAGALLRLGSQLEHRRESQVGTVVFALLTLAWPELFVIRPETISTPLLLIGLALWTDTEEDTLTQCLAAIGAGVTCAAAVYASPRFAVLLPLLLLRLRPWREWLIATIAAGLFITIYSMASGFTLREWWFALRFSAALQAVGAQPQGLPVWFILLVIGPWIIAAIPVLSHLDGRVRRTGVALLVLTIVAAVVCHQAAGIFRYPQAYAPVITAVAVVWAFLSAHRRTMSAFTLPAATTAVIIAVVLRAWPLDFLSSVQARQSLAQQVPAGESALVFTWHQPITVADASYYGSPLYDAPDRLCRAVRGFPARLPPCDIGRIVLDRQPFLVDAEILRAISPEEQGDVARLLAARYRFIEHTPDWPAYLTGILIRTSRVATP
jgi:hypothetical protein